MREVNSTNFIVAETIPIVVRSEQEISEKSYSEFISNTDTRTYFRVTGFFDEKEVILVDKKEVQEETKLTDFATIVTFPIHIKLSGIIPPQQVETYKSIMRQKSVDKNQLTFLLTAPKEILSDDDLCFLELSIQSSSDAIETAKELAIEFSKLLINEDNIVDISKTIDTLANLKPEDFTSKEIDDLLQSIKKMMLDNIPGLFKGDFINAMENHEFSHVARLGFSFENFNLKKIPKDKVDVAKKVLFELRILDETLAMFHDLRAQKILDQSKKLDHNPNYFIGMRLANMLQSFCTQIEISELSGQLETDKTIQNDLATTTAAEYSEDIYNKPLDLHTIGMILVFFDEFNNMSLDGALLDINTEQSKSINIEPGVILEKIRTYIENPSLLKDKFSDENYEKIFSAFNKRIAYFLEFQNEDNGNESAGGSLVSSN